MNSSITTSKPFFDQRMETLGPVFAERSVAADRAGTFPQDNYQDLKEDRFFSAMVPTELGGAGLSHAAMCHLIRRMAHYCSSTALAFSMHQHLIAANVWKFRQKGAGEAILRKVADEQLVLVSTGARDWLGSNGKMEKIEGGFLVSAKKHFASQSVVGDIAITSAPFRREYGPWKVLHFPVPLDQEGVGLLEDWDVLGMRATGSQTLVFDQVFVPEDAIVLERPKDEFHTVWHVVLTVALPLIMSTYVGIAEKATEMVKHFGKTKKANSEHLPYQLGRLQNLLLSAQTQWRAMYRLTNDFGFAPDMGITQDMLSLKTNVAEASLQVVKAAMEATGGRSFYRKYGMERLFRDVQAAPFHPMSRWEQFLFTGKYLLEDHSFA